MHILNNVLSPTSISQDLVGCTLRIETSCQECFHSYTSEDTNLILSTPVCISVKASVAKYLSVESIVGKPCAVCSSLQGFERETFVVTCGEFQIVHLKRFDNNLKKLTDNISCFPDTLEIPTHSMDDTFGNISMPVNCEDVCFSAKYRLIAIINHAGSFQVIIGPTLETWLRIFGICVMTRV